MRRYRVRFARAALEDLVELAELSIDDAEQAVRDAVEVLKRLPFAGRPAEPTLRDVTVPFGKTGYVVLYRVGPGAQVSVLAARHQLEGDFH